MIWKPRLFGSFANKNEKEVTIGGFTNLEKIYGYEPIPKELNEEQAKYVWVLKEMFGQNTCLIQPKWNI